MLRYSKVLLVTLGLVSASAAFGVQDYSARKDVQSFIDGLVKKDGFSRDSLDHVFAEAQHKQSIIDAITRPAEKVLKWDEYQDIFLTSKRIEAGRQFMHDNRKALLAAEEQYGVPPQIVAAIIGVETFYGQRRGSYRVIDALSTLAFDYPPRSTFFKSELRQFLLLAREEDRSPLEPLGSYAGAMGYGQFIPSSYRAYAVDFDGDGHRDIWQDRTDAIGSVANYLARHGWRRGGGIVEPAIVPAGKSRNLFGDDPATKHTMGKLKAAGVKPGGEAGPGDNVKVAPLVFHGKQGDEYWLGLHNFYVITRYNHSKLYAMAVYQLSEKLQQTQDDQH